MAKGSTAEPSFLEALLLPSGRVTDIDGGQDDARLIREIAGSLRQSGVTSTIVPPPAASDATDDSAERVHALRAVIETAKSDRIVLIAHSRGAQAALAAASTGGDPRIQGLLLLGAVVEKPTVLDLNVEWVDLVLGGDDFLAYADAGGNLSDAEPPQVHGRNSQANLVFAGGRAASLTILAGVGHTMRDRRTQDCNAVLEAIRHILGHHAGVSPSDLREMA